MPLFRPPYGSTNSQVAAVAGSEGFRYLVLWDVDPRDWAGGSAAAIANHVVGHAHNGAIVVMHLSAPHTAEAIPSIVSRLRAKGYEFVTVSTMLKGDRLFLDVDTGTDAGQAIARMVQEGFMSGYDGNYFGPGDTITRAQVAKVATLVGGLHTAEVEKVDSPTFPDVPPRFDSQGSRVSYPFDFVEEAAAAGLVVGDSGPGRDAGLQARGRHHPGAVGSDTGPHGPAAEGLRSSRRGSRRPEPLPPRASRRLRFHRRPRVCGRRRRAGRRPGSDVGIHGAEVQPLGGGAAGAGGSGYEPLPGSAGRAAARLTVTARPPVGGATNCTEPP